MSVRTKMALELMDHARTGTVWVTLLDAKGTVLTGKLFTAQEDYIDVRQENSSARMIIPVGAIASIRFGEQASPS